ncbi:ATP-dependent helicase, partial [Arthrobacter deserti]|nr:ATP-dependent helicase [Arthrobacter deserti]
AARLGLGRAVVTVALERLQRDGRVVEGEFRPAGSPGGPGGDPEWCDVEVLRRIRRRSLAALRKEVEPVEPAAYGRFLPAWQNAGAGLRGLDGIATVVDQLSGVPSPASAWEPLVLASRVGNYAPAMLDELMATGEVLWSGAGALPGNDGWICLHLAETADLTLNPQPDFEPSVLQYELLNALAGGAPGQLGGAYFFRQLADALAAAGTSAADADLVTALWELVWAGRIGNDTFAPVRALLPGGTTAHRQRPATPRARTAGFRRAGRLGRLPGAGALAAGTAGGTPVRGAPALAGGRWSLLPAVGPDATVRAHAAAGLLLDRYGVVTRGAGGAEGVPGGFALMYKVLARLEEMGRCRRGYFIEHLGAAQFAVPATVDRLRSFARDTQLQPEPAAPAAVALAATDPANPYGAALPWPAVEGGHRPGRKAGALVILVDGELALYVERGGKTLLTFTEEPEALAQCARALVDVIRRGAADKLAVEKVNGEPVLDTELARALAGAGFYTTPRGLRFRS